MQARPRVCSIYSSRTQTVGVVKVGVSFLVVPTVPPEMIELLELVLIVPELELG